MHRSAVPPGTSRGEPQPAGPIRATRERWLVLLLCGAAALRVSIFSLGLPFFNNVDEHAHFDLVVKYSRGELPRRRLEAVSAESAGYLARYGTPEYFHGPGAFPGGRIPLPIWTAPTELVRDVLRERESAWRARNNHESSQPPLYYALAGAWLALGRALGVEGPHLLYWIRLLNAPLAAALVWLAHRVAHELFPGRSFVRLAVAMLAALLPQDAFYSIQSDVLSPLTFAAAFLGATRVLYAGSPGASTAAATGLATAACVLVKLGNLPLLAVVLLATASRAWGPARAGVPRASRSQLILLLLCATLPVGLWMLWSEIAFGDPTGSSGKIEHLGWTLKPLGQWLPHPILTPAGLWTFWSESMDSFWRGEIVWHGERLASPIADAFYRTSSAILPGLALAGLLRRRGESPRLARQALWLAFWSFAAQLASFAALSTAFDFGGSFYPSRAHPYFTSGRLLGGALVPFLLLYALGLDRLLARLPRPGLRWLALAGLGLLVTASEAVANREVFESGYNWFHL